MKNYIIKHVKIYEEYQLVKMPKKNYSLLLKEDNTLDIELWKDFIFILLDYEKYPL